ncbi:nucleotidyltransferase family protein [Pseudalkalibacillus decolorationis]|uniref:nucleotidyltransferase family protein n=1 Tax=Pseudalkalibacillus decolorationis TaxID=163879 RepID=UPI0021479ADA|nr:nucleotidyltransferase domain-containing protein [Pseudalkalibacillus decolorationis]
MATHMELREHILNQLKDLINGTLSEEDVRVYLFGSWARKEEKQSSDIDIAVEPVNYLSSSKWSEIIENVEESTIPYHVDIVNLKNASTTLIKSVKEEGILWKDFKNG